jgi:hypothetical protein
VISSKEKTKVFNREEKPQGLFIVISAKISECYLQKYGLKKENTND